MEHKIAFLFPGQGAQYVGMGKSVYDAFPEAKEVFQESSDLLHQNMERKIFEGSAEELSLTANSQPAIFVVSAAILAVLRKQLPQLRAEVCAGLSLGEYTALFASEKISFKEALLLVAARGLYMQEACLAAKGGMRVVLGLDADKVQEALMEGVWIANLNSPGQVVIAGKEEVLSLVEERLKTGGAKRVLSLDVSGAFHTPMMASAQAKLKPLLEEAKIVSSPYALVMNVSGEVAKSVEEIRANLIAQVASPTKWAKGVETMSRLGANFFLEIGPSKSLAGMHRKIGVPGEIVSLEIAQDFSNVFEKLERGVVV